MAEELLLVKRECHICTLTINHPQKRNALNPDILLLLGDILNSLKEANQTRVVVIRGAGEESFSSGYDIGRIGIRDRDLTGPRANALEYGLNSITAFPYPVIAMIYSYAVGAGLELAATCDLRLAADNTLLGVTPAKLGVVYRPEGVMKFINLVGISATKELLYTGRLFTAQRAKEIGLVDYIYPPSELFKATYQLAQEITENSPLSVSGAKITINRLLNYQKLSAEDEAELGKLQSQAMHSLDLKEGQQAFKEKRKPKFNGS